MHTKWLWMRKVSNKIRNFQNCVFKNMKFDLSFCFRFGVLVCCCGFSCMEKILLRMLSLPKSVSLPFPRGRSQSPRWDQSHKMSYILSRLQMSFILSRLQQNVLHSLKITQNVVPSFKIAYVIHSFKLLSYKIASYYQTVKNYL